VANRGALQAYETGSVDECFLTRPCLTRRSSTYPPRSPSSKPGHPAYGAAVEITILPARNAAPTFGTPQVRQLPQGSHDRIGGAIHEYSQAA
jgi:hypothetical protein